MDLLLDIGQGAGLAAAAGIRPFLPALLVGALASANAGVDFGGTDYSFIEETWFLLLMFFFVALFVGAERRLTPGAMEQGPMGAALAGLGLGIGALLFAGSLADGGHSAWPGLVAGAAVALLAQVVSREFLGRVRSRLDAEAASALTVYAEGAALLVAGLSILLPPLGYLAVAALVMLLLTGRRRAGEKYAGLRILR